MCDYEDATPPSTLSPGRLYIFDQYSWDGFRVSFDDIGVNDISGSVNNSWLGDGTIVALHPSGAGDATQWVDKSGNQTSNYASVDDIAPDGDTTYVSAATPDLIDWYHLQDISLAEGSAIKAVVAAANGRVVTADGDTLSVGLKLGEDEVWIDPAVMTTSYAWIEMPIVNLALDNAPWNSDKINSLQIGIKSGLGS